MEFGEGIRVVGGIGLDEGGVGGDDVGLREGGGVCVVDGMECE